MLDEGLAALLREHRARRRFEPERYVAAKTRLLDEYLRRSGIRACVIGISGGIDSAVALGLLAATARRHGSALHRIVPALVPMFATCGTTNQDVATARGREVVEALGLAPVLVDLSEGLVAMREAVELPLSIPGEPWAIGQVVSYLRSPALYYVAALLAQAGAPAVVVGTTNRDEGSYIGFFGKASDAMVDVQLISDLHKHEVACLAEHLGVPESVRSAIPTGDTFDGRVDEDLIGAPYDFVELYEALSCLPEPERARQLARLSSTSLERFEALAARVEALHRQNLHKYVSGGSMAVHLDVLERVVPGGWRREPTIDLPPASFWRYSAAEMYGPIVSRFELDLGLVERIGANADRVHPQTSGCGLGESAWIVDGLLLPEETDWLDAELMRQPHTEVGYDGRLQHYTPGVDPVGTRRASCLSPALADELWRRLAPVIPQVRLVDENTPTDWKGHEVWRAIGINPLIRFHRIEPGGRSSSHYDLGYDPGDGRRRSLMSLVIYLTDRDNEDSGGATLVLSDAQRHLPLDDWDFSDRAAPPAERDILLRVAPRKGRGFVFDHFSLHAAEQWRGPGHRMILRTDVMFERCGIDALAPMRISRPLAPSLALLPREAVSTHEPGPSPLFDQLGITPDANQREVARAGARALASAPTEQAEDALRTWRLVRDRHYRACLAMGASLELIDRAGYFDDGGPLPRRSVRADPAWMVTPLHRVLARLEQVEAAERAGQAPRALTVVLMTGALCPVHRGHIELMEAARQALEREGVAVLGGYVSPGHDGYIAQKCGSDWLPAAHRLALCEEAVHNSDWLMADPWEALHCAGPVNFTDVIVRLEAYLAKHVRSARKVEVVYAFGSDRAEFALTFARYGRGVCVRRPGHEAELAAIAEHPFVRANRRVLLVDAPVTSEVASREIRRNSAWRTGKPSLPARMRLLVRDEGDWAIDAWLRGREAASVRAARDLLLRRLRGELERAFTEVHAPDVPRQLTIESRVLAEQAEQLRQRLPAGVRTLGLDPCILADSMLGVSRWFEPSTRRTQRGLVARPGWPTLAEQLEQLPAGEHVLVDDDLASGGTLRELLSLLPERCRVIAQLTAVDLPSLEQAGDGPGSVDLVDARDFIVGTRDAGLVVALPDGARARVPYALPYMRPHDYYCVPLSTELSLSRAIWQLNVELFQAITPALLVRDADVGFRALCDYLGFTDDTPLADVCAWHVERLDPAAW